MDIKQVQRGTAEIHCADSISAHEHRTFDLPYIYELRGGEITDGHEYGR